MIANSRRQKFPAKLRTRLFAASIGLIGLLACHHAPVAAPAAQPDSSAAPAPMGSSTSNAALTQQVRQLREKLDHQKPSPTPKERAMALARLHFTHRRFIEAAQGFVHVLEHDSKDLPARNLLARSLHLLGNSDQALHHLEIILDQHADKPLEVLDALFLLGAIALQDPHPTRDKLNRGKAAWKGYLKLAKTGLHQNSIQQGLQQLEKRLRELNGNQGGTMMEQE